MCRLHMLVLTVDSLWSLKPMSGYKLIHTCILKEKRNIMSTSPWNVDTLTHHLYIVK